MDWKWNYTASAEHYAAWLRRLVAALVAALGLDTDNPVVETLSRRMHRIGMRLLVPAEAALRRIVLMAAADRLLLLARRPKPVWETLAQARAAPPAPEVPAQAQAATDNSIATDAIAPGRKAPAFNLFDPLKRFVPYQPFPQGGIAVFADSDDDSAYMHEPVPARGLCTRLLALHHALGNLDAETGRLIRWYKRRHRPDCRPRRFWPLKPGLPPGFDPHAKLDYRPEVQNILDDTARLANTLRRELDAIKPDTS